MNSWPEGQTAGRPPGEAPLGYAEAESLLHELAQVFFQKTRPEHGGEGVPVRSLGQRGQSTDVPLLNAEAKYQALLEQLPAVVFMAYLDQGIGEAYVSPHIESELGYTQEEWLEDPVRWYQHIHPDDKLRWSVEAAEMFVSGKPLRSAYRVMARDSRVVWFHCEAKMIRREDGQPWFIHGVGFDITDLKQTEEALQSERNLLSAILDTVGALVIVLDAQGRIVRFNRACEQTTGHSFVDVQGKAVWELFAAPEDLDSVKAAFEQLRRGEMRGDFEGEWLTRDGSRRLIAWSGTVLPGRSGTPDYVIATGTDITERKRLEKAILEISAREQRRIGQDLHDGLGQHLTGIAFMSKVLETKLAEKDLDESADARKIVRLVNQAINKTRELSRGLLPVMSEVQGLMSALRRWAGEVEDLFGIVCRFECAEPVLIHDDSVATHLYHIAQEAVHNAIKHGHCREAVISLSAEEGHGTLAVRDDGCGISAGVSASPGIGLQIMSYRAKMIGGTLRVEKAAGRGTVVVCQFPAQQSRGAAR
jgi:PAS domain S-box-containing protein